MINQLIAYMQYPFVRYALIVGILIALCSSLLGVTLVLKRFSFIGDGLSHVAFGAMAVAAVAGITNDNKRRRGCGDDFGRSARNRLSIDERVQHIVKCFGRCLHNAVRLNLNPHFKRA